MKIGIIHTAFIGDIILTGLLLEGLYQANQEIVFFTKSKTSQILENDQRISKVVVLDKPQGIKKLFSLKKMVQQIKAESLDILICPHRSLTTTLCAYFSNVQMTIGFENATLSRLYKIQKPYDQNKHECLRNLSLIPKSVCSTEMSARLLQIGRPILKPKSLPMVPEVDNANQKYFVLALGTAWATKKYSVNYMQEVCQSILATYPDLTCYLTGDKNDTPTCDMFVRILPPAYQSRIINTCGRLNLISFMNTIHHAKFVLSNDSSPVHFASAFNIPTVVFFGPTIENFGFGPVADKHLVISHKILFGQNLPCQPCGIHGSKKCPRKHHLCMKKMTPEIVIPKIKKFLQSIL